MTSYLWPLNLQRQAWAFIPPFADKEWVLHTRGDEMWDDVVEIVHTFEPSLVVLADPHTPDEVSLRARHAKSIIEEANVGFIQIVVPIVGKSRTEQREFFVWADGIASYLPAPTEASLNNVTVDFRPGGHYAVVAPEAFTSNNFVGTWEIIESLRAV
jgi:hypothetical protein